jgi:predicted RecB family nuclease
MDFETLYPAIPRYSGMRPYSHVPFQWSVHRQQSPEAEVVHFEFLTEDDMDPRHRFLEALFRAVGQNGHVVVYNAGFEMQRLEELAEWVPERRIQVDDIKARIWDLYPFVKRHIYHPDFRGSFSLKAVLPALIPDLTYDGLEVGNGEEAGRAWEMMMRSDLSAIRKAQIKEALLAYCRQDTWALVSLLKFLKRQNKKT